MDREMIEGHPNKIILWEDQKRRICEYHECSDLDDRQYPDCKMFVTLYLDCPLNRIQSLLNTLNDEIREGEVELDEPERGQGKEDKQ